MQYLKVLPGVYPSLIQPKQISWICSHNHLWELIRGNWFQSGWVYSGLCQVSVESRNHQGKTRLGLHSQVRFINTPYLCISVWSSLNIKVIPVWVYSGSLPPLNSVFQCGVLCLDWFRTLPSRQTCQPAIPTACRTSRYF